jgi:hypothetical protein
MAFVAGFKKSLPAGRAETFGLKGASLWSRDGGELVIVDAMKLGRDVAGVKVEYTADGQRMFRRYSKV